MEYKESALDSFLVNFDRHFRVVVDCINVDGRP